MDTMSQHLDQVNASAVLGDFKDVLAKGCKSKERYRNSYDVENR